MPARGISLERLRDCLIKAKLSPRQASLKAGLDEHFVTFLLAWKDPTAKRKQNPQTVAIKNVAALAEVFGKPVDHLLDGGISALAPSTELADVWRLSTWSEPASKKRLLDAILNSSHVLEFSPVLAGYVQPKGMFLWWENRHLEQLNCDRLTKNKMLETHAQGREYVAEARGKHPYRADVITNGAMIRAAADEEPDWVAELSKIVRNYHGFTDVHVVSPQNWSRVLEGLSQMSIGYMPMHKLIVVDSDLAIFFPSPECWFATEYRPTVNYLRDLLRQSIESHEPSIAKTLSMLSSVALRKEC